MKHIDTEQVKKSAVANRGSSAEHLLVQLDSDLSNHVDRFHEHEAVVEIRTTDRPTFEKLISNELWTGDSAPATSKELLPSSSIEEALMSFSEDETWAEVEAAFAELSQETAAIIDLYDRVESAPASDEPATQAVVQLSAEPPEQAQRDDVVPEVDAPETATPAPWVGAEADWRSGIPSRPSMFSLPPQPKYAVSMRDTLAGLELTSEELQTVRTSLPPPPEEARQERKANPWKGVSIAAMFVAAVLITWLVAQQRFSSASESGVAPQLNTQVASVSSVNSADAYSQRENQIPESVSAVTVPVNDESWDFSIDETSERSEYLTGDRKHRRAAFAHRSSLPLSEPVDAAGVEADAMVSEDGAVGEASADDRTQAAETPAEESAPVPGLAIDNKDAPSGISEGVGSSARQRESDASANPAAMSTLNELLTTEESDNPGRAVRSAIPELPSKDMIASVMAKITPNVKQCKMTQSGRLVVKMVVSGETGRVVSSQVVDDTFRGTSTGLCAARAVRVVKLPAFQREKLIIKYPFDL
ncbi:MAG: hypothetical protein JXX29_01960 [Deltaproteobacteria bacterium]|nr:hypothetical protein [Deltaproteobacteria bacterium]MBN2670406.1 hypothetical protein [Deltaproteobacteria bacterium]